MTNTHAAYRNLRNRLAGSLSPGSGKTEVVVICSRRAGDGTTTVALDLARTLSEERGGEILFVTHAPIGSVEETELRGKSLRIDDALLAAFQQSDDKESIPSIDSRGLAGVVVDLPSLNASGFDVLRTTLFERYSVVIVDAGSIIQDRIHYWARLANQLLLVVDSSRTTTPELEYCRKELAQASLDIDGIILNKKPLYVPSFFYRHFG